MKGISRLLDKIRPKISIYISTFGSKMSLEQGSKKKKKKTKGREKEEPRRKREKNNEKRIRPQTREDGRKKIK